VNLQELCAERGLTLEQLADRAGVALTTLTKLDAGAVRANQFILPRLADALGLAPAALRDALSAARRTRGRTPSGRGLTPWP
jgi:transcriptional regulator with XRE-family HTH domain